MPNPDVANKFNELALIRDTDGPLASISLNRETGRVTFMLTKEFDRGGKTERTPYFSLRHIAGLRRLLDDLEERLPADEDRGRAAVRMRSA